MTSANDAYSAGPTPERRAIVRLLGLMRDGKEAREYLARFSALDQSRFAIIKVGGAILRDAREPLAEALAFLHTVGLTPIVVHGAGPQLDAELKRRGVASPKLDGLRVTTPDILAVAREVFTAENLALTDAVRAAGARAAAIPLGVIDAKPADDERLGLVGSPLGARTELVESAARAGAIPVLSSLGLTEDGRLVNVNADAAVRALVAALQPYKIVFLTETGAVLDEAGAPIQAINLATDYDALMDADWLHGGMRVKVQEIATLLDGLPLTSSVSVTRPEALAQELFTHGGAGTLVRKGEKVLAYGAKAELDASRVRDLVTRAFGRPPAAGWWEGLDLTAAYLTENARAGAFLTRLDGPEGAQTAYLDKFAVLPDARGEGLGQAVWRVMRHAFPRLVWRARPDNPINDFYAREADGQVRQGDWIVFWKGVDDLSQAAVLVEQAAARPATLEEAA